MSQAWLITSGKGGTGKSLVTAALGCSLADNGYITCLIDGSFGLRGLDFPLGVQNNVVFDADDVLNGRCSIADALITPEGIDNLYLLAAPQKEESLNVNTERLKLLIRELKRTAAYVLIDMPTGMNDLNHAWAAAADGCIMISTPEEASIRCCDQLSRVLRGKGLTTQMLLVNQVMEKWVKASLLPTPQMVAEALDLPLLGYLPEDEKMRKTLLEYSYLDIMKGTFFEAIDRISGRILGEDIDMPNLRNKFTFQKDT